MNDQPGAFPTAARTECEFPQPGQNRVPKATAADGPQQPRASPVRDIPPETDVLTPMVLVEAAAIRGELAHLTDGINRWAGMHEALSGEMQQLKADKRELMEMHDRNQSLAEQFVEELKRCTSRLEALSGDLQQLKTDKRIFTEMHDRNRSLTEQFHEHQVIMPVMYSLIGVADRCNELESMIEHNLKEQAESGKPQPMLPLEQILNARKADRIDIENTLANFGVEPFQNPSNRFDPASQQCMRRVEAPAPQLHGKIAGRLLPGYSRNGRVIRREQVDVYVTTSKDFRKEKKDD